MNILFRTTLTFLIFIQLLSASQIEFTQVEKEYISKNMPFVVQGHTSFPPFNYSENGKSMGYTFDYMQLMEKYSGIKFTFTQPKPWGETMAMFQNNEIDILPHLAKNKSRAQYIEYTNFNHLEYVIGVTVRKNDFIHNMDDLKDKVIAVVNKSFVHTFLKKNYLNQKLLLAPATSDAVSLVSSGKADAFIGSIPMMDFYIKKSWYNNLTTKTIDGLGLNNNVLMPMGVHKGNTVLKSILEKANAGIPYSEIIKLKEKWLNINHTYEKNLLLSEEEKGYLQKKENIKMCIMPNSMPFGKINKDGQYMGIGENIIRIISKKIDKEIVLINANEWGNSLENLKNKQCDIIPTIINIQSRHESMNFTQPFITEPLVVVTKSDKVFINDSSELSNKKIGIIKNYAYNELFQERNKDIDIIGVKSAKDGLEKVRNGMLFGYIDTVSSAIYNMQTNSMADLKIAGKMEFDSKLSMASRKDEPLLNSILIKTLDTISEEEIKKIIGKWLSINVEYKVDYSLLFQISTIFMFIILIGVYKNRQIKQLNEKLTQTSSEVIAQQRMVNKYVLILNTNLEGIITEVNDAYCKKMGFNRSELINHNFSMMRHPDMPKEFFKALWEQISNDKIWQGEIKNLTREKQTVHFQIIIEPIIKKGIKVGYRSISEDITDKKRIEELSITDKLTGLYNRMKLDDLMDAQVELKKRYNTPFSIILIDIDNFKLINDTYGHDVGDEVLKTVASLLKKNIRKTDYIIRWGGEEFLIICQNTQCKNSYILAEKIRKSVMDFEFEEIGKQTLSLGVAEFDKETTITTLFKVVDNSLYEAKLNGKNQTVCYCKV